MLRGNQAYVKYVSLIFGLLLTWPFQAYAWDTTGHRLSAEIAYASLSPCARKVMDEYLYVMHAEYPAVRTVGDFAAFPDWLKARGIKVYNYWHYYAPSVSNAKRPNNKVNALWALNQTQHILSKSQANPLEKAFYLAFDWHIVGDLHQPLHTYNLVNKRFLHGDRGGLLYRIRYPHVKDLHVLWDQGVDHFGIQSMDYPLSRQKIKFTAMHWMQEYPPQPNSSLMPRDWLKESQKIAQSFVYTTPYQGRPDKAYLAKGSKIAKVRVIESGYRMAKRFEQLFADEIAKKCPIQQQLAPAILNMD